MDSHAKKLHLLLCSAYDIYFLMYVVHLKSPGRLLVGAVGSLEFRDMFRMSTFSTDQEPKGQKKTITCEKTLSWMN